MTSLHNFLVFVVKSSRVLAKSPCLVGWKFNVLMVNHILNSYPAGGFKQVLFSILYGYPSHWLICFRGAETTNQYCLILKKPLFWVACLNFEITMFDARETPVQSMPGTPTARGCHWNKGWKMWVPLEKSSFIEDYDRETYPLAI